MSFEEKHSERDAFHLDINKFAGELDIANAIFRDVRVEATIAQKSSAQNKYRLPRTQIKAELEISVINVLNRQEGTLRFEGVARLLIDGNWGGHHTYYFVFVIDMKSRTGSGMLTR